MKIKNYPFSRGHLYELRAEHVMKEETGAPGGNLHCQRESPSLSHEEWMSGKQTHDLRGDMR
jgi:hypothetical protein